MILPKTKNEKVLMRQNITSKQAAQKALRQIDLAKQCPQTMMAHLNQASQLLTESLEVK